MERQTAFPVQQTAIRESALATNKVLRNTYLLLSATLAFSAIVAGISYALSLPYPGPSDHADRLLRVAVCRPQDGRQRLGPVVSLSR